MTIASLLIGVWCLLAAAVVGYLLWRLDAWTQRRLDDHVEQALEMAKDRHPARVAPRLTPPAPTRTCPTCHGPVPFGPIAEHYCGGTR